MIAVQVIPDRFAAQQARLAGELRSPDQSVENHIRRPTRGIVPKEETFATLRLVTGSGQSKLLVDAGSKRKDGTEFYEINGKRATDVYSNFFLQQVQEERAEKQQILETFGESYIFLFGERARVASFAGVLLNTFDFNWEAEWWHNYEEYLRGTKAVQNDARVFLSYDETLVSGYIIGCSASKNTQEPNHVNFQFQLFITGYSNFSKVGSPEAGQGFDYKGSFSTTFSESYRRMFRPTLVSRNGNDNSLAYGKTPTLADGIQSQGVQSIRGAFSRARDITNSSLKRLSNLVAGEVVRVPYGFEGSLAFDDDTDVAPPTVKGDGRVVYSTFDRNEDEYVGRGTHGMHYGSSMIGVGMSKGFAFGTDADARADDDRATVEMARSEWKKAGIDVPDGQFGVVSKIISAGKLGLLAIGATQPWRTKKPDNEPVAKIR